jgi:Putative zinc-finger
MSAPCDPIREQMDRYIDRELPDPERVVFDRHIRSCPSCAAEIEMRSRLRAQVQAAVRATPVPAGLETRVRQSVRAHHPQPRTGLYAVAAAAALIIIVSMLSYLRKQSSPEEAILAKTPGRLGAILNVGLRDHLKCAVFRKYTKQPEPASQMAADLGPQYAALLPLIQAKLPADFQIIQAHRCTVAGRPYTHFIIMGGGKLISLILTSARPGEWLSDGIHQAGIDRFQVVGFESHDHLAYIVSDLDAQQNLQWAANMAPVVRDYLAMHAGRV